MLMFYLKPFEDFNPSYDMAWYYSPPLSVLEEQEKPVKIKVTSLLFSKWEGYLHLGLDSDVRFSTLGSWSIRDEVYFKGNKSYAL